MSAKRSLSELERDLHSAGEALKSAELRVSMARNEETTARNRVNELQREIVARIDELKKAAPRDTEWRRDRGVPVTP